MTTVVEEIMSVRLNTITSGFIIISTNLRMLDERIKMQRLKRTKPLELVKSEAHRMIVEDNTLGFSLALNTQL